MSTPADDATTGEEIYRHPHDYDLELAAQRVGDVDFWTAVLRREQPRRVLELGCGTGRLTVALAELGCAQGFRVLGLDREPRMLVRALDRWRAAPTGVREALQFVVGDLRQLPLRGWFDVVLLPYGTAHHLAALDDQLATWHAIRRLIAPQGLFAVDVCAPDLALLARARERTDRAEDLVARGDDGRELRRNVAVTYDAATQQALFDYAYVVQQPDGARHAYQSPFAMHVYYPRELLLLFRATGFRVEQVVGSYAGEPFGATSPLLIVLARPATNPLTAD
ncbi:MAG TPA: class I SAM-dependent methyltransferase [Thermomicrobiales bacterium]|nr:class I SAM-dependent methyltransferase [Thermomicrobiales bacterium]